MITSNVLRWSCQINDGLTETSADGANLAFDKKYGIMFCVYMPGKQGSYGESRGKIALTYFPASQPTNSKTFCVSQGDDEYLPNILGLGDGKVRLFYEKNSKAEGDHLTYYKDFDFLTEQFTNEQIVMLKRDDGKVVPLTQSEQFKYLEQRGYFNHVHWRAEQAVLGGTTFFEFDGQVYGATSSLVCEAVLYRSRDNLATVEFFAVCPYAMQYEFDYKILDDKMHAIYRTEGDVNTIYYTCSSDFGKTWDKPKLLENSISCRPRIITYQGGVLLCYNYDNADTNNRPSVQQNRTAVKMVWGDGKDSDFKLVADLHSKYGIVNVCIKDVLGDVYFAYSTSELALEYQNGNELVRGKDAIRYVKLGDLISEE